eukprot:45704-Prorocentrum_minimum.AAC.2
MDGKGSNADGTGSNVDGTGSNMDGKSSNADGTGSNVDGTGASPHLAAAVERELQRVRGRRIEHPGHPADPHRQAQDQPHLLGQSRPGVNRIFLNPTNRVRRIYGIFLNPTNRVRR